MSFQARKIVEESGINVEELIKVLNKAYADEFLAWYQYYSAVGISKGLFRSEIEKEFLKHAEEELKHAELLKQRIIELNGIPLINPQEWYNYTNCGYKIPNCLDTIALIEQNIESEQCAIKVYKGIMEATKGLDPITFKLARNIMIEEIEHEQDLTDYKDDICRTIEIIKNNCFQPKIDSEDNCDLISDNEETIGEKVN